MLFKSIFYLTPNLKGIGGVTDELNLTVNLLFWMFSYFWIVAKKKHILSKYWRHFRMWELECSAQWLCVNPGGISESPREVFKNTDSWALPRPSSSLNKWFWYDVSSGCLQSAMGTKDLFFIKLMRSLWPREVQWLLYGHLGIYYLWWVRLWIMWNWPHYLYSKLLHYFRIYFVYLPI